MSRVLRSLQYGVGTLVIYLAVSLLGWGLGDLAGYFGLAPRVAYAAEVLLLAGVAGYQGTIAPEGIRGGKDDRAKRVRRQTVVSVVLILVMYAALFFLPYADRRGIAVMPVGLAVRWIGALATAGGFALVMGSGIALGRMYSKHVTVQQEHRLVTTSIYRAIRHPRYLGVLLLAVGLGAVPSTAFWQRVAARIGTWRALRVAFVTEAVGVLLAGYGAGVVAVAVGGLLLGGTFVGITALGLAAGRRIAPMRADRVIGWMTAAFGLGQWIGPAVAGRLAEASGVALPVEFQPADAWTLLAFLCMAAVVTLLPALKQALAEQGREDIMVVIGGVIPPDDVDTLKQMGAAEVFLPGTVIADSALDLLEKLRAQG